MKSSSAVSKMMMSMFQENPESYSGIEKKASLSGASCEGISLCLYLALLVIFASPSTFIKSYCCDFDNIVLTKNYSLDYNANCDNKI